MNYTNERSKQMRLSSFRRDRLILFLTGCAFGVACFLWVYGYRILDPQYDAWLFNTDMDLKQHYIGFCHYRMSDLRFPIGLVDTLSYPASVSIIYTDSIPLVAFVFKLFNRFLPQHFQYFGMFGLLSFMLMGGISAILVYSLIGKDDNKEELPGKPESYRGIKLPVGYHFIISAVASLVFILSFTVLHRMFYHTALGAQWIIILALYIWINREDYGRIKVILVYALMGVLCVGIHTYYVPMVGSVLLAASVEHYLRRGNYRGKSSGINVSGKKDKKRINVIAGEVINLLAFCVFGLITLFVFGGFYGGSGGRAEGFGSFTANLNTFINPLFGSAVFKPLKLYYDWQYEGYAYLGLGIILMVIVSTVYLARNIRKEEFKNHTRFITGLVLLIVDLIFAMIPIITFGDIKLLGIPLPGFVRNAMGIFRSNGRFIWVPMYLIMLGAIVYSCRSFEEVFKGKDKGRSIVCKLMAVLLLVQVLDAGKVISTKQAYFKEEQAHFNLWMKAPFPAGDIKYKEFAFLYNDNDIIMDTAFYAYLNNKRLNNFYYARNIDEAVNKNIEEWKAELREGIVREDVIYICKVKDYEEESGRQTHIDEKYGLLNEDINWYTLDKEHLAGVKKR
ncbi:MAG: DUF6311 domain-containing protein [Lachnospiraceae bacterium]|nr:DUF6311 domain-containing protein [Lachnospiraceae bacterium]